MISKQSQQRKQSLSLGVPEHARPHDERDGERDEEERGLVDASQVHRSAIGDP